MLRQALFALALTPLLLGAIAPERTPYLQAGTGTSMAILWPGPARARARVQLFDGAGRAMATAFAESSERPMVRLAGLTPGTAYAYTAYEGGRPIARGTFRTNAPPHSARVRFAVIGDSGSGNENQGAVARRLAAYKPDFVLHVGDVVYERGEAANYPSCFFQPYGELLGNTVFYAVAGNHDYGLGNLKAFLDVFEAPRARPQDQENWYTFSWGPIQFFALDTNLPFSQGSPQYAWLSEQLERSRSPWKMAFFHHPPYSSGGHGSSHTLRQAWSPLFERYNVQLAFAGHEHHYERTLPREDFVRDAKPTTYVVTGGGGAWVRPVFAQAFSALAASAYHFVAVELDGDSLSAQAIRPDGTAIDAWRIKR